MARSNYIFPYSMNFSEAEKVVNTLLQENGFFATILQTGEQVWKKGTGVMTAMQFIKVAYEQNRIIISAWVQIGLGSVGAGEMDLNGLAAIIPKASLKGVIKKIEMAVQ